MIIDYSYLRDLKSEVLKQWHHPLECKENLKAYTFHDAVILPLRKMPGDNLLFGRGGVIDSDKKYVDVSAINKRIHGSYEVELKEKREEVVVYCGYLVPQWGHFLIEAVARLWYVERCNNRTKYVYFIRENEKRKIEGNYKEFFELLGIWDRIEIINKPIQYSTVIVPELGYCWKSYYSDNYKRIFFTIAKNAYLNIEWKPSSKIFLSRSKLKNVSKKEFGLEILDSFFENNGFEIIYPERISLSELIFKMKSAECIASLSGSLPHNLLFSDDRKKIIILERNVLCNEIQADIDLIKDLCVIYIDANIPIYSIDLGYGPFILSYDGLLKRFADDNNMKPPAMQFVTKRYMDHLFIKYMRCYEKTYHYQWYMQDWSTKYTDYMREGYKAGFNYYKEYLTGEKPFFLRHFFMPHYWKQVIKRLIRKIRCKW